MIRSLILSLGWLALLILPVDAQPSKRQRTAPMPPTVDKPTGDALIQRIVPGLMMEDELEASLGEPDWRMEADQRPQPAEYAAVAWNEVRELNYPLPREHERVLAFRVRAANAATGRMETTLVLVTVNTKTAEVTRVDHAARDWIN